MLWFLSDSDAWIFRCMFLVCLLFTCSLGRGRDLIFWDACLMQCCWSANLLLYSGWSGMKSVQVVLSNLSMSFFTCVFWRNRYGWSVYWTWRYISLETAGLNWYVVVELINKFLYIQCQMLSSCQVLYLMSAPYMLVVIFCWSLLQWCSCCVKLCQWFLYNRVV